MTPEQWQRAEQLFEYGMHLSRPARNALLANQSPDDCEVAENVARLWHNLESAGLFLEIPIVMFEEIEKRDEAVLNSGRLIAGRFTILELVGAGGMGEVYRARDERLGRFVALKALRHHLMNRQEYRARLEREARAVSSLAHPRICALYDVVTDAGLSYLVMEFLSGELLSDSITKGGLTLDDVLRIAAQIAEGIECAHTAGIVHRDLKPGNVMMTETGIKILDFGVSKGIDPSLFSNVDDSRSAVRKQTAAKAAYVSSNASDDIRSVLPTLAATTEGQIVGTVAYMSPEQAAGRPVGAKSDIFSFGAILYEMVTGHRPFDGDSLFFIVAALERADVIPIQKFRPACPSQLGLLIHRCLEKDPDNRPASINDIRAELESIRDLVARRRAPWRRIAFFTGGLWPRLDSVPGGRIALVFPFVCLAIRGVEFYTRWDHLPHRFPVHWGFDGPDRWVALTPTGVYGLLLCVAIICTVLLCMACASIDDSRQVLTMHHGTIEQRFRRYRALGLTLLSYVFALTLPPMSNMYFTLPYAPVLIIVVVIGTFLTVAISGHEVTAHNHWKLGIIYFDPGDPALFVESRFGLGWTINFGNHWSWVIIAVLLSWIIFRTLTDL